ncbi:unnamed protein product [Linum tenue]|uniref:Uncharacterized protein n=1 Tax=Linum tenue TaxID=586396 RepID=A0AAV0SAD0_9ROSI|nr:unnamed protein product [Linum tenue]
MAMLCSAFNLGSRLVVGNGGLYFGPLSPYSTRPERIGPLKKRSRLETQIPDRISRETAFPSLNLFPGENFPENLNSHNRGKMDGKLEISIDKLPVKRLEAIEQNCTERFPTYVVGGGEELNAVPVDLLAVRYLDYSFCSSLD